MSLVQLGLNQLKHKPSGGSGGVSATVANQTIYFGALTLSNAGGAKAINSLGAETDITAVTGGTGWSVLSGRIRCTAPAAATLTCTTAIGTFTATIVVSGTVDGVNLANAYSVKDGTEGGAACAVIGVGGGKTLLLRHGSYARVGSFLQSRAFTSEVVLKPHQGATATFADLSGGLYALVLYASSNITIDGLTFYGASTAGGGVGLHMLSIQAACSNITVKNCLFYGDELDPDGDYSTALPARPTGLAQDGSAASSNTTIINNTFHDLFTGVAMNGTGLLRIEGNHIYDMATQCIQVTWTAGQTGTYVKDNFCHGTVTKATDYNNPHGDLIQFTSGIATADWVGIECDRNIFAQEYTDTFAQGIWMSDIMRVCTIDTTTDEVTCAAHGFIADQAVMMSTDGALPTGLAKHTYYYVKSPATNTFQLAATPGGAAINMTGSQSGVQFVVPYFYSGVKVRGNLIVNGQFATCGIRLNTIKNARVIGNTVVNSPYQPGGCGIILGEVASVGTHTVVNNAADVITVDGTWTNTNNIPLGNNGAIIAYATAFDGPTFTSVTRAGLLAAWDMKTAGPLDLATNVGAAGSGYVTWATTNPGNNGSLDSSFEGTSGTTAIYRTDDSVGYFGG